MAPLVPVRTLYHPITGIPVGTAPADNTAAAKKILRKIERDGQRIREMARESIAGYDRGDDDEAA